MTPSNTRGAAGPPAKNARLVWPTTFMRVKTLQILTLDFSVNNCSARLLFAVFLWVGCF